MVEGVDERQSRSTIEGSSIIQSSSDAHRRLVDVGDTKVDFPHICKIGDRTREGKGGWRIERRRSGPSGGLEMKKSRLWQPLDGDLPREGCRAIGDTAEEQRTR